MNDLAMALSLYGGGSLCRGGEISVVPIAEREAVRRRHSGITDEGVG